MITLSDIRKIYRMGDVDVQALAGVSLTIAPGEFVAIMGPSGSGKSTLMHILGLLDVPDSGSYKLNNQEVSKLSEDELAALRAQTIGFVFQQFNLLARTSALENVALPLIYAGDIRTGHRDPREVLDEVGLGNRIHHKPSELSGGQQQRVAIARALINNPQIIFADEPTGNLDTKSSEEIMQLLTDLNKRGITVVLVTHEDEIARHAKRVIRMRDGKIESDTGAERNAAGSATRNVERPSGHGARRASEAERRATEATPGRRERFRGDESASHRMATYLEHFKQAGRALLANKVRTALSVLGILIGVAAVIAMVALGGGAQKSIEDRLSSLGSNLLVLRPGSRQAGGVAMEAGTVTRFTLADAEEITRSIPSVKKVSPSVSGRGQAVFQNKNWNTRVLGAMPDYAPMRSLVPTIGRFFTQSENATRSRVAVLGMTLVRELFGDGANPLGENIKINKVNFQVIGILPEKGATTFQDQDDVVVIPLNTAMRRLLGKNYVDSIDIEIETADQMASAQDEITELILRSHRLPEAQRDSFQIRNMAEIQETLSETTRIMTMLLASIAAISLLVGGIGIMNIMLVSVTERTREIGLRKAVGAKRQDILVQFLIESIVVSVLGGCMGIALGWGITVAITAFAGWATSISPVAVAMAFFFSAAVGIVFGLWPAQQAARLNPIEALRYE